MRKTVLISASSVALACLAAASPLLAQSNTGTDASWSVQWFGQMPGTTSSWPVTAVNISTPPSAWANTSPTSYWIGANSTATLPGGTGDNADRYVYNWFQTFTATSTGPLEVTVWTDNFFHSFTFNGVTTTVAAAPAPGDFSQPQARTFTIDPIAGVNHLSFNTSGDGMTDAINVSFTSTPEPSSMALLGTGLVGLVPMVRRRRRKA